MATIAYAMLRKKLVRSSGRTFGKTCRAMTRGPLSPSTRVASM